MILGQRSSPRLMVLGGLFAMLYPFAAISTALADDEVVVDVNMIQVNEQQLVQWVFGNQIQLHDPLRHAENGLQSQIDLIESAVALTKEQRQKLEFAGRGDIHRFMDRFKAMQRECPTGLVPQDEWQEIWQKAQPLQARYRAGLHGRGSLLQKTIRSALDEERFGEFQKQQAERNRRHYHAIIKATVAMIDQKIPLTAKQREELIERVTEKTEPPEAFPESYYQYHVVLLQMSKLPEEDLKPIFAENEWNALQVLLRQGRVAEAQLRQVEMRLDE